MTGHKSWEPEPNGWPILDSSHLYSSILNFPYLLKVWLAGYLSLGYFEGSTPLAKFHLYDSMFSKKTLSKSFIIPILSCYASFNINRIWMLYVQEYITGLYGSFVLF